MKTEQLTHNIRINP